MVSRLAALLGLFFFSGACGLVYQVLWLRLLALVFGVTVYAASTVLAAFMAGLALGSLLAGRFSHRIRRPLVVFGVAEIGIGAAALASPLALDAASGVYAALHQAAPDSMGLLTLARLVCSFVVLLVPTVLMGLTLPLLSASALVRGSGLGARVGALYAVNTAGAVTGALLTGYVLIGALGIQASFLLAAAVNAAVGVLALGLARSVDEGAPVPAAPPAEALPAARVPHRLVWLIVGLSGFAALALELVWFRILLQYLPATTYAFTTMLATVLAGIAIGGAWASRVLARDRDWLGWLAAAQIATGVVAAVSVSFLAWSYQAGWKTSGLTQASVVAILPAAILMGLAFPLALRLGVVQRPEDTADPGAIGRRVGGMYATNVGGAILGALVGGFLLLPAAGSRASLALLAGLFVASGWAVLLAHPARRRWLPAGVAGLAAFAAAAPLVPDPFEAPLARRHGEERIFWREEGVQTSVAVHTRTSFRGRILYLDGLHQANDSQEMVTLHRIIGHLPMALHPDPRQALVVGLGGGATAGAVSQHEGADVTVVELSASVARAAEYFAHVNYDVLDQPNVRLRLDDGRNFLSLTDQRFDVITADIIQPMHAGAGNLYSREYFGLVRRALAEDGLVLQWIGHRDVAQYKLIMRTFLSVFPDATLWFDGHLMLGSTRPFRLHPEAFEAARRHPRTREALDAVGLTDLPTLRSWYTGGPEEMRRYVGEGPILTDDRPLVEYHRSLPPDPARLDIGALRGDIAQISGS